MSCTGLGAIHYISRELFPASGTNGITITSRVGGRRPKAEATFVICILLHGGLRRQEGRHFGGTTDSRKDQREAFTSWVERQRQTGIGWTVFLLSLLGFMTWGKGYLIVNKRRATIYCLLSVLCTYHFMSFSHEFCKLTTNILSTYYVAATVVRFYMQSIHWLLATNLWDRSCDGGNGS